MTVITTPPVFPNPIFEGSEKRIEIDFSLGDEAPKTGLRALSRDLLDELMSLAHCTIVSSRSNSFFDAYVLSESSLFVYPTKWVLKTCGTTRLLKSVPRLLEVATAIGLIPQRCKYNRASYLFPERQPSPHTSFEEEENFLDDQLKGYLDLGRKDARVLGAGCEGLQWHIYTVGQVQKFCEPTYNVEMCMTDLGQTAARQFFRDEKFISSVQTTRDTGIINLKPNALIDDYVFEPCGYSMNGIDDTGLITIHVTPEKDFSYASVEISGLLKDIPEVNHVLASVVKIFNPGKLTLAISADNNGEDPECFRVDKLPHGYGLSAARSVRLPCGSAVSFFSLVEGLPSPPSSPDLVVLTDAVSALSSYTSSSDSETDQCSECEEPSCALKEFPGAPAWRGCYSSKRERADVALEL